MSGVILAEERKLVCDLLIGGQLNKINGDFKSPKNGGIFVNCADGDIDALTFWTNFSTRPHSFQCFGGALLLSPSFRGFQEYQAFDILENISWGMEAKDTQDVFLAFHWPCGVGQGKFNHKLEDVFNKIIPSAKEFIGNYMDTAPTILFHNKRINKKGLVEQNMYLVN